MSFSNSCFFFIKPYAAVLPYQCSFATIDYFLPQVGVQLISTCESNCTQTLCSVILNGFERLLLTNSISKQEGTTLLKLASDRLVGTYAECYVSLS